MAESTLTSPVSASGKIEKHRINPRSGYRRRIATNAGMLTLTGFMTVLAIIPLFWIIGYVLYRGSQYINLDFFTQMPRPVGMAGGGVLHAIEGTLILTFLSALFAIPPGILAAFYVAYHPNTPLGTAIRFGTDVLSGIPSIVIGIFGYALVVKTQGHYSAFAGGIVLAILMLPTIIRTTEEMIKLVPHTLREGSLALGAPEWKTALSVTLPAAMNGIITGVMLGIARASGETAPLLFTALGNDRFDLGQIVRSGVQSGQSLPTIVWNMLGEPVDSLPLTLYKYTQQPSVERINQSWAVALVLMVIVLLINLIARAWVHNRTSRLRG
jgi:phosphate transport system permease protein